MTTNAAYKTIFIAITIIHLNCISVCLQKGFISRVFFLDYILATANDHSQSRFDELLFVWPLPFDIDLSDMDVTTKNLFFASVACQVIKIHKLSHHIKVVS